MADKNKSDKKWCTSHFLPATKYDVEKLGELMAIKVSEIKAAVAEASKENREAFTELGAKIADLQKQIDDLIAGQGDPTVTDAQFEADLADLKVSAKALADIVPGSPA